MFHISIFTSKCCLQTVKNVLAECYGDKGEVSDELVDYILTPGLEVCCSDDSAAGR